MTDLLGNLLSATTLLIEKLKMTCSTWSSSLIPALLIILTGVGIVKGQNEACMLEGKSYTSSFSRRKHVSVPQESSSQTTQLLLGFNDIEELYHYEFMGWDGLWLLKIANYAFKFESIKRFGYKQQCNS